MKTHHASCTITVINRNGTIIFARFIFDNINIRLSYFVQKERNFNFFGEKAYGYVINIALSEI